MAHDTTVCSLVKLTMRLAEGDVVASWKLGQLIRLKKKKQA